MKKMAENIEISIKQGNYSSKVILSGEALKDVENMSNKLETDTIIEAIIYSIKILSEGIKGTGTGQHKVELPNGKKVDIKIE